MQRNSQTIRRSLISALYPLTFAALLWVPWGCGSHPTSPVAQPSASVAPSITAADIQEIKQDIRQVQTTVATTSYALDGERAQLARAEAKDRQKLLFMMIGILTGFVLLCLCLDSPVPGAKRWIAVMAAFTVIVGAMVVPFFWPF